MADWSDEFDGGDELLLTRGTQTKPVAKTFVRQGLRWRRWL